MKTAALAILVMILIGVSAMAGEYLTNDTGAFVNGLRVAFTELVTITGFGDVLTVVNPEGEASEFLFTGAGLEAWEGHWFNWEPESATILDHEWITGVPLRQWDLELGLPFDQDWDRDEDYWVASACRFTDENELLIVLHILPPDSTTESRFGWDLDLPSGDQFVGIWTPGMDSVVLKQPIPSPLQFWEGWSRSHSVLRGLLDPTGASSLVSQQNPCSDYRLVDLTTNTETALEPPLNTSATTCGRFSFSRSGRYLVAAHGTDITIWDTESGIAVSRWESPLFELGDYQASPVFGFNEDSIVLNYRRVGQTKARVFDFKGREILGVTALGDSSSTWGAAVAAVVDNRLFLVWDRSPSYVVNAYELDSSDVSFRLTGPNMGDDHSDIGGLVVHPSGDKLLVFGERWNRPKDLFFMHLWDIERATLVWSADIDVSGTYECYRSITISPDGKYLAAFSSSGGVVVFELPI